MPKCWCCHKPIQKAFYGKWRHTFWLDVILCLVTRRGRISPTSEYFTGRPRIKHPRCITCNSLRVIFFKPDMQCYSCGMGWGPDPGGHHYDKQAPDWVVLEVLDGKTVEQTLTDIFEAVR